MSYQRGSLKKVPRKAGETWVLRYRVTSAERRVEHIKVVGFVRDFPKVNDARREADRLLVRINEEAEDTRIHFDALAEHYLKVGFREDAVSARSQQPRSPSLSTMSATTSSSDGVSASPRTSSRLKFRSG